MISEEDILNIMLSFEKNMSDNYSVAINEMSNKVLYKKIISIFDDTKDMGREIYNLMYSNFLLYLLNDFSILLSVSLVKL